jgi:hypothetical protein
MEFARQHKKPRMHLRAGDNAAADKLKTFTEEPVIGRQRDERRLKTSPAWARQFQNETIFLESASQSSTNCKLLFFSRDPFGFQSREAFSEPPKESGREG